MTNFLSLADFARLAPEMAAEASRRLGNTAKREVAKRMAAYSKAYAPVGGVLGKDRHAGELKASFKSFIPGSPNASAAVQNTAPHSVVIDRGRRRGKRARSRKGVKLAKAPMLGSKQAPKGYTRPAWARVLAEGASIVDIASREAAK